MSRLFGEHIRRRRRELGFTQDDLAKRMGVSQPTVSTWETGESTPEPHNVRLLADVLKVDVRQLGDHLMGDAAGTNAVERAIAEDDAHLSRKEQRALLAAYGELARRSSLQNAEFFVWGKPPDLDAA